MLCVFALNEVLFQTSSIAKMSVTLYALHFYLRTNNMILLRHKVHSKTFYRQNHKMHMGFNLSRELKIDKGS